MCSAFRSFSVLVLLCATANAQTTQPAPLAQRVLKVVADPNNLPFSSEKEEGFENKIAKLIADELGAKLEYTWYAQRRGYVRNTIKHGDAEIVMGVPTKLDMLLTTSAYYRSSYVFVTRADRKIEIASLDDPTLRKLRVGVQLIGDDGTNSPPAHLLGMRGIIDNVIGYSVYSDYRLPNPPARVIDAVANGEVDVAIAWGPLAGYFAKQSAILLKLNPVAQPKDSPYPLSFDISIGVKRKNGALRDELNAVLARKMEEIAQILDSYGVPR